MEAESAQVLQQKHELVYKITAAAALQTSMQYKEAVVRWTQVNELAVRFDLKEFQEIALRNLGFCYDELKDYEQCFTNSYQAFHLAVALAKQDSIYTLLERLGTCCMQLNSAGAALSFFDELFQMASLRADINMMAQTAYNAGVAHTNLKQYNAGLDDFRKAKRYGVESGNSNIADYATGNVNKIVLLIGEVFIKYVSAAIAAQAVNIEEQPYQGDFKHDLLCALMNISHYAQRTTILEAAIQFNEPPVLSDDEILVLTGNIIRSITGTNMADPKNVYEAARFIVQVKRGINAQYQLQEIHKGYVEPDISGTGSGKYILYLRSFIAKAAMPRHLLEKWGDVSLEEIVASRLDAGSYPLIALGNLEVQDFGAGKIQTDDATWQRDLVALGRQANYIIVVPCVTDGTCWELEWIVVNQFLRKTVFVMPAVKGDDRWWQTNWATLRQWSRYLGLSFPEYDSQGLFFALTSEGGIATADYHTLLYNSSELHTSLLNVLSQYIPSTEWLTPVADNLSTVLLSREAERRNITQDEIIQEQVEQHVQRIAARLTPAATGVSPYLLGMVERGLQSFFSSFTNQSNVVPAITGFYTIWDNATLLWAAATTNLSLTITLHAEGKIEADEFSAALFKKFILPGADAALKQQIENGLLSGDKLTRLYIRRNLRYRYAGADNIKEAQQYATLICNGVLDAGRPLLIAEG